MSLHTTHTGRRAITRRGLLRQRLGGAVLAAAALLAGCQSILDVDNPNNVSEDALQDPASGTAQANGALAATGRMFSAILTPYAVATDELDWIGSREAWGELDIGVIANPMNEFTDQAFPWVAEARFVSDQAIRNLESFEKAGTIRDPIALARAYLYGAIVYTTIADVFEDFTFSEKTQARAPVGPDKMVQLYDTAVKYLDLAEPIAARAGNTDLRYAIVGQRARTKHARAVWRLINPKGTVPANPLVNDAGANADATAALALKPGSDDAFRIFVRAEATAGIHVFFEVNGRNEQRIGRAYRTVSADKKDTAITLLDPISGRPNPAITKLIGEFENRASRASDGYVTVVSDRELQLILAEAAQAAAPTGAPTAEFTTRINNVRRLGGLPDYTGQVPALTILKHERQANTWLQLRRLNDLYRFNEQAREWTVSSSCQSAKSTPGLFFPIPNIEVESNPLVTRPTC